MEAAAIVCSLLGLLVAFSAALALQNLNRDPKVAEVTSFIGGSIGSVVALFRGMTRGIREKSSPQRPLFVVFLVGVALLVTGVLFFEMNERRGAVREEVRGPIDVDLIEHRGATDQGR
jgi:uncharacterized membrane protein YdcZ (DUF606 family)